MLAGRDCSSEIYVLLAFIAASFSSIDLDELVKKSNRIHTLNFLKHAMDNKARTVETNVVAEEERAATINKLANLGKRFYAECTPGYYNPEGKEGGEGFSTVNTVAVHRSSLRSSTTGVPRVNSRGWRLSKAFYTKRVKPAGLYYLPVKAPLFTVRLFC